jgi:hypothetical protein
VSAYAVALGDITETVMGQAPPGVACNKEGRGTVFVKAGEFSDIEPVVREWTTAPLKFAKKGDVLVCVVGATAGKINLGIDCAIGRSVAAVRPDSKRLDTGYLHYFLRTRTDRLRAVSQGLPSPASTSTISLSASDAAPSKSTGSRKHGFPSTMRNARSWSKRSRRCPRSAAWEPKRQSGLTS